MGELWRLVKAEAYKTRHTLLPWIHVLVPALGIAVFLFYYRWSIVDDEGKVYGYMQTLSIVLPLIVSVICSLSVEMEEQGHFQTFLGTAVSKKNPLLAKWILLSGMGLLSILLATGGFAAGYRWMTGRMVYEAGEYMCMAAVLWLGGADLYLFHLFLNLTFSKHISMCVGTAELLVAALFLTGLGEGLWQIFPCSWGSRWCGYLLLYWEGKAAVSGRFVINSLGICAGISIVLWGLIFLWFHFFEGRQCHD